MNKLTTFTAAGAVALALISPASAAWYAKYDGVDGRSVKNAEWRGENTLVITTEEGAVLIGMLVPAVQKVRESAARAPGRARTVAEFELSNGAKSWTLYDAVISPTSDPRQVELRYRCMDWANSRTGVTGSDCPGGTAAGKVDYGWKVEEGEQ